MDKIFTVLEKIGKRPFWSDENIGAISGNITVKYKVHIQPIEGGDKKIIPKYLSLKGKLIVLSLSLGWVIKILRVIIAPMKNYLLKLIKKNS